MHIVVVPGSTDINRGDQALIWETARLFEDLESVLRIYLLDHGETRNERDRQISQTAAEGYNVLRRILPHPRRGSHSEADKVKDRLRSWLSMGIRAAADLFRYAAVIRFVDRPGVTDRLLDADQQASLEHFRTARAVVVKGGGFLHANGEATAAYYMWYQLFYMRLAKRLGIPVIMMPNSYGPFEGWNVKPQIRKVLGENAFVTARERISAGAMGRLLGRDVPVSPDLAYYLEAGDRDVVRDVARDRFGVPLGGERACVAITVRPYRFPGHSDSHRLYSEYIDAVAAVARHIENRGMYPVFVTHVAGPSAHENDSLAIADVVAKLGTLDYGWIDWPEADCRDIKALYGCFDYLIGTRFHSVIFAQGFNVPSLAIAYGGNKSTGIMRDIGLGDLVVPIEDVSAELLCDRFDAMVRDEAQIRSVLGDWNGVLVEERGRILHMIKEYLAVKG